MLILMTGMIIAGMFMRMVITVYIRIVTQIPCKIGTDCLI